MPESVRLLASLTIDGRALRCDHAVLLLAEPPAKDWLIALLGVADADLERLSTAPSRWLPASCTLTCASMEPGGSMRPLALPTGRRHILTLSLRLKRSLENGGSL